MSAARSLRAPAVMIRMKLRVLAHGLTGPRAALMVIAAVLGLALAAATVLGTAGVGDLLAAALGCWLLGWLAAPLFTGGVDGGLRPEYFAMLPFTPATLTRNLLITGFVGVGPAISLVAFSGLLVLGGTLGVGPAAVAVPGVLVQLAVVVVASRVCAGLIGEATRTATGGMLVALPWAVLVALGCQLAIVIYALGGIGTDFHTPGGGFSPGLAGLVRALPSGWGVVAVEAAAQAQWWVAIGAMVALCALVVGLLKLWSVLMARRITGAVTPVRRVAVALVDLDRLFPRTPLGAVLRKELRSWGRDRLRTFFMAFAVFFAVAYTTVPLLVGLTAYLPWTGAVFAVMAAAASANLYSADGSALWLTVMVPGSTRADVRGRQAAWLLVVAPLTVLLTVGGLVAAGQGPVWPWALAVTAAVLGAGAGYIVAVSVLAPVRMPDAHRRTGNPAVDGGNFTGLVFGMLGTGVAAALPAAGVVLAGVLLDVAMLQWLGPVVGLVTGAGLAWVLGRVAYRRLDASGPELLLRLRTGRVLQHGVLPEVLLQEGRLAEVATPSAKGASRGATALRSPHSPRRRVGVLPGLSLGASWIPLLAGVLSLLAIGRGGSPRNAWALAAYLPSPFGLLGAVALILVSAAMLATGGAVLVRRLRGVR